MAPAQAIVLEEALLSGVEATVMWANQRLWKQGAALRNWNRVGLGLGIYFIESGSLDVVMAGNTWSLGPGSALLVPADMVRERIVARAETCWFSVGMRVQLYQRLNLMPLLGGPHCWQPGPELPLLIKLLVSEWEDIHPGELVASCRPRDAVSRIIANGLALSLFGHCWRTRHGYAEFPTQSLLEAPPWLWDALQAIRQEPEQDITALCQRLGISPAHLRRTFHRFLGQSPKSYLTEERLQAAHQLLLTTDDTVATIAARVGFSSLSHFTHIFVERYLMPPARYRELQRERQSE